MRAAMLRALGNRFVSPLAGAVDRIVSGSITGRSSAARARSSSESLGAPAREVALRNIAQIYAESGSFEDTAGFFGEPQACTPSLTRVSSRRTASGTVDVLDARWPSRTETFCTEPGLARRFSADRQNQRAAARLFLHADRPRPTVIIIHGYRAGQYGVEERVWPTSWLLDRGVDLAFFVLPFHAVRTEGRGAQFPGSDPRFTIEGFRQAIDDLQSLTRFLLNRGSPAVGAMGMSLGGYTVALLATVDPMLRFAAMMIPLASFADVARAAGRLVGTGEEQVLQHQLIERAHAIVSPFSRKPRVEPGASLVIGGEADRITPMAHAERLAHHFDCELVKFPGGHLLQVGRADGFRAIGRLMRKRGMFEANFDAT